MHVDELINCLRYSDAPFYLYGSRLYEYPGYAHIFRQAHDQCALHGVYALTKPDLTYRANEAIVPVVYICEAATEAQAIECHRLVWNQNIVPFLVVLSPRTVRLYPGFRFDTRLSKPRSQSLIEIPGAANDVLEKLGDFTSNSIDSGEIWKTWHREVTSETRVDRRLLKSLKSLGAWLQQYQLPRNVAHALIGKYVYLHYLKDRKILSDRKFEQWKISKESVFGRQATLAGFYAVTEQLEEWLNGTIFPIPERSKAELKNEHLQKVSATFLGDDPGTAQMHLDFRAYNFGHIPIETLSMVYQEFLHSEGRGREQGAYYTPIHLTNFVLDELHAKRPLNKDMKVLDPACGSGAFIVQCYRRLIEQELMKKHDKRLSPSELRELLVDHIYGMDVDEDACAITELSLVLTLLDYVEPPDLEKSTYRNFKLPFLRNQNIFHSENGFFETNREFQEVRPYSGFDWIVGNPPWKQLNATRLDRGDSAALDWIKRNSKEFPVGDNQLAEAFAWHVMEYISRQGFIALLMPASTLFKIHAQAFRQRFFSKTETWCVVNFSNLRHILFHGAKNPAAAFFYSLSDDDEKKSHITTYAPLAVAQLSQYENKVRAGKKLWTILVNADQIREVSQADAVSGESDPWKFSMWGSVRDRRLLESITKRFVPLSKFARLHNLSIHEGLQLRSEEAKEPVEFLPEVIGKKELDMAGIRGSGKIHFFPDNALRPIDPSKAYVRKGRGKIPLKICYPPHIIVNEGRTFAVFSDEFLVVPPRQIGIAGDKSSTDLLKALALYVSSDFAVYQQYITSPAWGIERDHFNKKDLEQLPVPLDQLPPKRLLEWVELHDRIASVFSGFTIHKERALFDQSQKPALLEQLRNELNERVYGLLDLDEQEQWLVHDFLNVRMKLNEGRIANEATKSPTEGEMRTYARILKKELDEFLDRDVLDAHRVTTYYTEKSGLVKIEYLKSQAAGAVRIVKVEEDTAKKELENLAAALIRKRAQWIYFNRNLKIFEGRTTYFLKPLQRLSWLKSQALLDADEFIAEKLISQGN